MDNVFKELCNKRGAEKQFNRQRLGVRVGLLLFIKAEKIQHVCVLVLMTP